ncbi:MAG: recombinase family protein [Planctomycetota bacterium]|nr:recombinase family protein [Planctomycetota bacterium]
MTTPRKTRSKHVRTEPAVAVPTNEAVTYCRVSTKDQEKEGFSIPAQDSLLRSYAAQKGYTIVEEFVDAETAGKAGRSDFTRMLEYLRERKGAVRVVLVEKTDRLYRNFRDYVTLDELDLEIHLVKENVVLSKDSRSSEKFMHGIRVLMARNYLDNLSEETRKGHQAKAEAGIYPSVAPIGYRNVEGPDRKRIIVPEPEVAPFVALAFERFATGNYSLEQLTMLAAADGLVTKTGKRMGKSAMHHMLRNPLFMGQFDWRGKRYQGTHTPLVSFELWEQVQAVLTGRYARKRKTSMKHALAYSGLLTCGHCGCALTGDVKKGKYVYYRCTHNKQTCPEPYVREEVLTEQFAARFAQLRLDAEVATWFREALKDSHADERAFHDDAVKKLQAEHARLQQRIDAAYIDKLDGKITGAFFDEKAAAWRAEQAGIQRQLQKHEAANASYTETGARLFELAQTAAQQFVAEDRAEKRELVKILCSNSTWANGRLEVTWAEPFGALVTMNEESGKAKAAGVGSDGLRTIWLLG